MKNECAMRRTLCQLNAGQPRHQNYLNLEKKMRRTLSSADGCKKGDTLHDLTVIGASEYWPVTATMLSAWVPVTGTRQKLGRRPTTAMARNSHDIKGEEPSGLPFLVVMLISGNRFCDDLGFGLCRIELELVCFKSQKSKPIEKSEIRVCNCH